jgi:hypothetical protein
VYGALLQLGQQAADPALECAGLNPLAAQESFNPQDAITLLQQPQQLVENGGALNDHLSVP